MLDVDDTLEQIPDMSSEELDQLAELVQADTALDDEEKDELYDAIEDELEERESDDEPEVDIDIDDEDEEEDDFE